MRNIHVNFLIFSILFTSCNEKKVATLGNSTTKSQYPFTINISEGLKNQTEIKLSDVADSIKYIILSKEKTVAINFVFYIALTDNNIIAHVSQSPFLRFDINGKFLDTISRIGRGPDEYLPGSKFAVNPVSNEIIVYRNFLHDFIQFSSDGRFIDKHPLKIGTSIESFECLSSSKFALFPVYDGREIVEDSVRKNMILLGLFNLDGSRISVINHPAQNIPSDFIPSRFFTGSPVNRNTYYNNEVVTPCYENSVYKINLDSIYTGFKINWGNLRVPKTFEEKYYLRSSNTNVFDEIRGKFIESPTHAFFILNYEKNKYLIEYEKQSGLINSMKFADQEKTGFINDIDGGQPFFPFWTNRKGDIWIDFVDAMSLKSYIYEQNIAVNPKNHEKLIQFISDLQPDDNPILRTVYLKK